MSLDSIQEGIEQLGQKFAQEELERKSDLASLSSSIHSSLKPLESDIPEIAEVTRQNFDSVANKSDQAYEQFRVSTGLFEKQVSARLSQLQAAILAELKERVRASIETATLTESFLKTVEQGITQDSINARSHLMK
jgi:hypothetical protein